MLTLYFSPGSSSMAVHIALHEIGVEFEPRPLSFVRKEQRDPAFLAVNPEGKVPTLVIDGRPLTEVAAILFYLAKRYKQANLLPANDPEAEAQAIAWMSYAASTLHPARRQGTEHALAVWKLADKKLGQRMWALGRYSIADIHLFRLFWRFGGQLGAPPDSPDLDPCPNLTAHRARMMAREAVRRTIEIESKIGFELPP